MPLVRQLLRAQEYWRVKGLRADVVILNEHPAEYLDETQNQLTRLVQEPRWAGWLDKPGGIFLLRAGRHARGRSPAARRRWRGSCCAAIWASSRRSCDRPSPWLYPASDARRSRAAAAPGAGAAPLPVPPLSMANGLGGFTPDGREYVIVLDGDRETPLPWSNVIANPEFGTMVSASGSAFTWAGNSRENRLTPFANDPIRDPTGEAIYLRDEDSGAVWGATPGPLPRRPDGGRWVIRHAAGVTRYQHAVAGLTQELTVFVAPDDPVKLSRADADEHVDARAATQRVRLRRVVSRAAARRRARFVVTEIDEATGAILARTPTTRSSRPSSAFWHATEPRAFVHLRPRGVRRAQSHDRGAGSALRDQLAGRHGAGLDPCGALQVRMGSRRAKRGASRSSSRRKPIGAIRRATVRPAAGRRWITVRHLARLNRSRLFPKWRMSWDLGFVTCTLGYATASTVERNLEGQLAALNAAGVDPRRVFTDKLSDSAERVRAGLHAMLSYARSGDTVVVVALDRLGRSAAEVTRTIADLTDRGIRLRTLKEGLDTGTSTGRVIASIFTSLAQLDLQLDHQRH